MEPKKKDQLTVEVTVDAPVSTVWEKWTNPEDICRWNNASPDWHTTKAENNLTVGGKFLARMEAKDGSFGFDFWGVYDNIITYQLIEYTLGDERKVVISFQPVGEKTKVVETFEAETTNSLELQQGGWQAIMDNFKRYVEAGI